MIPTEVGGGGVGCDSPGRDGPQIQEKWRGDVAAWDPKKREGSAAAARTPRKASLRPRVEVSGGQAGKSKRPWRAPPPSQPPMGLIFSRLGLFYRIDSGSTWVQSRGGLAPPTRCKPQRAKSQNVRGR